MDVRVGPQRKLSAEELILLNCGVETTLESPLDCKEIKPVNPKGNQSWIFIGRTDAETEAPILWPPDGKNWLIGKDPDAGKDWRREKDRGWDGWMASPTWWIKWEEMYVWQRLGKLFIKSFFFFLGNQLNYVSHHHLQLIVVVWPHSG